MAEQLLEGLAPTHLSLDYLDALIATSQEQIACVNKLFEDR